MSKETLDFIITQYGKVLDVSKYTIDIENKVLTCTEDHLDITLISPECWGWTVNITGEKCTVRSGNGIIFNAGYKSTFNTGSYCTFKTGDGCTFHTASDCVYSTGRECSFHTYWNCTFNTGECCIFSLESIKTCKFQSYDGVSIILDRIDKQRYVLTKELIDMLKVING